jgi:O-antigen ligase
VIDAQSKLERAAFALTFGSAVAILFSIAASNILLALAFSALLMFGAKLRFPPIKLPLAIFLGLTVLSLLLSSDPASGRPQLRKFFVFLTLLAVTSTFRTVKQARWLVLAWAAAASLSAIKSFVQFSDKLQQSRQIGQNFYQFYMEERTSGFMSHWMTFGSQEMYALLLLGAFLFWSPARSRKPWIWLVLAALIAVAILLGFTRGIWLATGMAGLYLVWHWNRKMVLLAPVVLAILIMFAPGSIRTRLTSFYKPQTQVDSNQHRIICWRTGLEMIRAKPLFGLGPEQVNLQFMKYVPPDIAKPLPTGWYGHLHNIYLHYAAERGIPAMLALMWLIGKALRDWWRALRKLPPGLNERRFLLQGAIACVFATLIVGIFEYNLGDSEVLIMFLAILGIGYLAADRGPEIA